jgi:two-component system, chemotaxis family, protein-glutamate methylesterase/glutaminase
MYDSHLKEKIKLLVIGGSAGSFPVVCRILEQMPVNFSLPIVMCLHRLKDKREGFKEALEIKSKLPVHEPNDKDPILSSNVYIAPANYHLLIDGIGYFGLSTTEMVQYSRPSIDVLFESAADHYGSQTLAVVLSGANRDGALGSKKIHDKGGTIIVQDPRDASITTMPSATIEAVQVDSILIVDEIIELLKFLHN